MKISVILAHPETDSFSHAIGGTVVDTLGENGHDVFFHDLYEENFNALLPAEEIPKDAPLPPDVQAHCSELAAADAIIVIHPNWWGQPPAVLKGWVDRVIRPGLAYEFIEGDGGEGIPHGLLKAETALVFNSSNTGMNREKEVFGDPLETIWKNCIFGLCGIDNFYRRVFAVMVTSSEEKRRTWLEEVRHTVAEYFPETGTQETTGR